MTEDEVNGSDATDRVKREVLEAEGRELPAFVWRELEAFLRCGILAHGLARVHCDGCGKDDVVAFSCKRRGFCPSCGGRRMADEAAWLVDRVLPRVPVRQWVLSLPYVVRWRCAYDRAVCRAVRRILVRAIARYYAQRAQQCGIGRPQTGSVAFEQRFDSGLRLNLHWHVLWLDGAFAENADGNGLTFRDHGMVSDADVASLVKTIRDRVRRWLRKHGKWSEPGEAPADDPAAGDPGLWRELGAAAIQGRTAMGEGAGGSDERIGRGSKREPWVKGPLCADLDGFSLNATVRVPDFDRQQLERLCRYCARPAIAESRLSLRADGKVVYQLKKRWKDGTTHVVLDPQVLMERLCALVPAPRRHLLTYHGVLAPAASDRDLVVPAPDDDARPGCRHGGWSGEPADAQAGDTIAAADASEADAGPHRRSRLVPHRPARWRGSRPSHAWADLLRRVFLIDVLQCPHCGGRRRLLAAIHDPGSIQRVLAALGLSGEVPELAPARGPPDQDCGNG